MLSASAGSHRVRATRARQFTFWHSPGLPILASRSAGITCAAAASNLFCQPLTTPPSPTIIALKPSFAIDPFNDGDSPSHLMERR